MRIRGKWLILSAIAIVLAVSGYAFIALRAQPEGPDGMICHSGRCTNVANTAGSSALGDRPVLNPLMFVGVVRQVYIIAQQNPWLLSQLWCYCGCDRTNGHRSLLDCYRDYHGATCAICSGEALEANQLFNQGSPVEQIREALRARFSHRE